MTIIKKLLRIKFISSYYWILQKGLQIKKFWLSNIKIISLECMLEYHSFCDYLY